MNRFLIMAALFAAGGVAAQPEYTTIELEIDVAKPGDGGMGTVRVLAGGRIIEIMVAQTELSYGYTQPAVEGQFYNLYHGFMEARPVTAQTSKILYTLVYDISDKPDQAAKDADIARRTGMFEGALKNMKALAEK